MYMPHDLYKRDFEEAVRDLKRSVDSGLAPDRQRFGFKVLFQEVGRPPGLLVNAASDLREDANSQDCYHFPQRRWFEQERGLFEEAFEEIRKAQQEHSDKIRASWDAHGRMDHPPFYTSLGPTLLDWTLDDFRSAVEAFFAAHPELSD